MDGPEFEKHHRRKSRGRKDREGRSPLSDPTSEQALSERACSEQMTDPHPIEFAQTIQPHGMLMALDETDFSIVQVSTNAEKYLGIPYEQLVGMSIDTLFDLSQTPSLLSQLFLVQERIQPIRLTYTKETQPIQFDGFIHRNDSVIILELELKQQDLRASEPNTVLAANSWVRESIRDIRHTKTYHDLLNVLVHKLKDLTGYDRVLVYAFDADNSGEVVAEARSPDLQPYLGLHFPAMDIPTWVRRFYSQGKARTIPDMQAEAVSLFPAVHPQTQQALNLGLAVLRSPDDCCVEYYGNMGMSATFVVSILIKIQVLEDPISGDPTSGDLTSGNQTLWGLIACHHPAPAYLSYDVRASGELLVQVAAAELESRLKHLDFEHQNRLHVIQSELVESIAHADNLIEALINPEERLLNLVQATGAVICLDQELTFIGTTPSNEHTQTLIQWIDNTIEDDLFQTQCLSEVYSEAIAFKEVASGLLLLRISAIQHYLILWFRPEVVQTISWGGNPEHVEGDKSGNSLGPRTSFERWEQTVHATAHPWQAIDIRGATELRQSIVSIVLKKAEEMASLNLELQRSNRELTAFAYAAAHDLKEPLRGIYNYANILQEDYGTALDADGLDYLTEIQGFAQRMETLINALLRISQLRQATLNLVWVDLNEILDQTIDLIHASQPNLDFEVRVPKDLPHVTCDAVLIGEVLRNLLSNALKYNDRSEKWIEIGYRDPRQDQGHPFEAAIAQNKTAEQSKTPESFEASIDEQGTASPSALFNAPPDTSFSESLPENPQSTLVFYIQDNGIGIREPHLQLVFKLFKRLHPQEDYGGGAGVGLAVVNQIIERHGGKIWVESAVGMGSTFCFTLGAGD